MLFTFWCGFKLQIITPSRFAFQKNISNWVFFLNGERYLQLLFPYCKIQCQRFSPCLFTWFHERLRNFMETLISFPRLIKRLKYNYCQYDILIKWNNCSPLSQIYDCKHQIYFRKAKPYGFNFEYLIKVFAIYISGR